MRKDGIYEIIRIKQNQRFSKVEGKMGDYEAPSGWEEVEMNETNVTQLQTRSTFNKSSSKVRQL